MQPSNTLSYLASKVGVGQFLLEHYHVGLVVKASASRAEDSGFKSRLRRDFYRVES